MRRQGCGPRNRPGKVDLVWCARSLAFTWAPGSERGLPRGLCPLLPAPSPRAVGKWLPLGPLRLLPPAPPSPVAPGNRSWLAVEQPIPTLEGNVYFLLQIAPAAAWWLNEPFELLEAPIVGGHSSGGPPGLGYGGDGASALLASDQSRGSKLLTGTKRSGGGVS